MILLKIEMQIINTEFIVHHTLCVHSSVLFAGFQGGQLTE